MCMAVLWKYAVKAMRLTSLVKLKEAAPARMCQSNWAARREGPGQTHFCYNSTGIWTSTKHIHPHKISIGFYFNNVGPIFPLKTTKFDNIPHFLNPTQNPYTRPWRRSIYGVYMSTARVIPLRKVPINSIVYIRSLVISNRKRST